jgi:tetratricopeptide (TPR) repeat protein
VDRALSLAPEDETTLATSAWLHLFANDPPAARELAARARVARPKSAAVALVAASAERHATGDLRAARAILDATRPVVDPGHLHELEGALAWLLVDEGRPADAAPLFRTILNRRADEPDALQGLMNALAFLPGANEAELRTVTSTLVKKRAGSRGVRAEAAIALARLGDVDAARPQVAEGLLNAPDSDEVWAAAAYVEWRAGDRAAAAEKAGKAMSLATTDAGCFNDLAAIVAALCHGDEAALARLRARAARPPEHVYVAREHSYRSVHRFGPLERELLGLHATGAGSPGAPAP